MTRFVKSIGLMAASVLTVYVMYRIMDRYLDRFRKNYITIENEYMNV